MVDSNNKCGLILDTDISSGAAAATSAKPMLRINEKLANGS